MTANKESSLGRLLSDWQPSADCTHHRIAFGMDFHFFLPEEPDPGKHQESAKDVDDPLEPLDQAHAHQYENGAHDQRSDNSPKEHPMLLRTRNMEIPEYQQEDKEVINT